MGRQRRRLRLDGRPVGGGRGATDQRRAGAIDAGDSGRAGPLTGPQEIAASRLSFLKARPSTWRTRSLQMPSFCPISFSVWPSARSWTMDSSRPSSKPNSWPTLSRAASACLAASLALGFQSPRAFPLISHDTAANPQQLLRLAEIVDRVRNRGDGVGGELD